MRRATFRTRVSLSVLALASVARGAAPPPATPVIAPTEWRAPEDERRMLHVPPGFEVQLVAAEPDIHKPMNIAFDTRGRLWLTDTVEYPFPVPDDQPGRDTVKILADFGDDGRARKITTFATGLNIPLGVLPLDDGKTTACLAYGIPSIRRFTDTDGDGKADRTDVLLTGFTHTDTHGMTNNFLRGFDGWVYADHGFKNTSTVRGTDGSQITMTSGNCYRFRTDGSRVEFWSHGQVNPFGLCFDPLGNLFSADCHSKPQYVLLRGAYYPSFGIPDDGLGFGPVMCDHDHGSTAISGTLYYAAEQFPKEYWGRLFNGNVVTNCVDSDTVEWHGSSPRAVQGPEFVRSDDPWFRPVQVKLGPDGAVYVADFYNRIIGHYEVDLKHPGRDRTSGRIWRIVYKGDAAAAPAPALPDLTKMPLDAQVALLGDANLTTRLLATNHIADTAGAAAVEPLRRAVARPANAWQKVHALWALYRLGGLTAEDTSAAVADSDRVVRVHAMRILADMPKWDAAQQAAALGGLTDADPMVRQVAADALGRHPDPSFVRPLLAARTKASADDMHLAHVLRIALRDQVARPGTAATLPPADASPADRATIADVAVAVPGPEAAALLVRQLRAADVARTTAAKYLRHAARYAPPADVDALAALAVAKFGDDVDLQLELLKSVRDGLGQRGAAPGPGVHDWAVSLARQVFAAAGRPDDAAAAWSNVPIPNLNPADPWSVQPRPSADGDKAAPFFSSLPRGETLTGVLRSRPFAAPPRLSFYIAGHDGLPGQKAKGGNAVRLRAADTNDVLAEAKAPRNDVAQPVTWDLSAHAGRQVFLEASDRNTDTKYAWLAFGRIDPPVVRVPAATADPKHLEQAAEIAGAMKLADLAEPLRALFASPGAGVADRTAAAKALVALDPAAAVGPLGKALDDPAAPPAARGAAAAALAPLDLPVARSALIDALRTAPQALQTSIATSLAGTASGAEALLDAVAQGKASPRLLQDKTVVLRLALAKPTGLDERIAALTKGMVTVDEAVQKLIDARRAAFAPAKASAARGHEVFVKNCTACHQIANEGARIGPQLDGVGKRGVDRIVEDVLDPSRNVDAAFRYSVLTLDDGDLLAGLQRREEGEALVFADAQGKEFTVPKARIKKRAESQLSLMPANFGDTIPPAEFDDLLAFLLSK